MKTETRMDGRGNEFCCVYVILAAIDNCVKTGTHQLLLARRSRLAATAVAAALPLLNIPIPAGFLSSSYSFSSSFSSL